MFEPIIFYVIIVLFGLLIGSFINVIIYRLPIILERQWKLESAQYLNLDLKLETQAESFNLIWPRSHCPHCLESIKFYDNIPLLSFFLLGGKCRYCKRTISWQYPVIEVLCALLALPVAIKFGMTLQTVFALILTWSLVCLAGIDLKHLILPDNLTLPLLWLGLLLNLFHVFTDIQSAIFGAVSGYLILWLVYQLFYLLRHKEGIGYGDFKLAAMLGAFLGWQMLPLILLLASLIGTLFYSVLIFAKKHSLANPVPFGPYIAIAGYIALIYGNTIVNWYMSF